MSISFFLVVLMFDDLTPLHCVMRTAKLVVQLWQNARSSEVLNYTVNFTAKDDTPTWSCPPMMALLKLTCSGLYFMKNVQIRPIFTGNKTCTTQLKDEKLGHAPELEHELLIKEGKKKKHLISENIGTEHPIQNSWELGKV